MIQFENGSTTALQSSTSCKYTGLSRVNSREQRWLRTGKKVLQYYKQQHSLRQKTALMITGT
jgi:hypothetical protein